MSRTDRARLTGAMRRALDAHRRVLAFPTGEGALCACSKHFANAEAWKRHQAQQAAAAAESVLVKADPS